MIVCYTTFNILLLCCKKILLRIQEGSELFLLQKADILLIYYIYVAIYKLSVYNGKQKIPISARVWGNFYLGGKAMFNNPRYATSGINSELPLLTQIILWGLIDTMEVVEKDYLQVFLLSIEDRQQRIIHEQEQPEYRKEYLFPSENPVTAKVYVIDDKTHSTMLLAEEY